MVGQEWTAHQRAGWIVLILVQGNKLTTAQVARLTGLTWVGAHYMMRNLSLLPWGLWQDDNGLWQLTHQSRCDLDGPW